MNRAGGHRACSSRRRGAMSSQNPPRDDDPAEMTDFEKNATLGELEQLEEFRQPEPVGRVDELDRRPRPTGSRPRPVTSNDTA